MNHLEGTSAEAQLVALYGEREQLLDAIGVADANSILAMISSLESQLRSFYEAREGAVAEAEPRDHVGDQSADRELCDLRQQRDELEQVLGVCDSKSILGMVRSLEAQLRDLYSTRETDANEAAAVVQQIKAIAGEIGRTHQTTELLYENERGPSRWAVTWKNT